MYKIERIMEESPISQLCFLLMMYLSMQLFFVQYILQTPVQDGSLAIIRQPVTPTVRYYDSPLVPQSDSLTEMCLFSLSLYE